jgi:hypothetical protein
LLQGKIAAVIRISYRAKTQAMTKPESMKNTIAATRL